MDPSRALADRSLPFRVSRVSRLSNSELVAVLEGVVSRGRKLDAAMIRLLGEVDARKLYREHACSSLFRFCTERLGMSEGAAYKRIAVARCARRLPVVLEALQLGRVHLAGLAALAPHLTAENSGSVLQRAKGKSKREIEGIARSLSPVAEVQASIRRVSAPRQAGLSPGAARQLPGLSAAPAKPARIEVLAPARYHVRFTASERLRENLERARELAGYGATVEGLFERAMELLVVKLEKDRLGAGGQHPKQTSRGSSRYVARAVRRQVHERDGGQCTFKDESGRRCSERIGLELDHVVPFARGGGSTAANLRLRCRPHNQLHAEACFGPLFMAGKRQGLTAPVD